MCNVHVYAMLRHSWFGNQTHGEGRFYWLFHSGTFVCVCECGKQSLRPSGRCCICLVCTNIVVVIFGKAYSLYSQNLLLNVLWNLLNIKRRRKIPDRLFVTRIHSSLGRMRLLLLEHHISTNKYKEKENGSSSNLNVKSVCANWSTDQLINVNAKFFILN